MRNQSFIVVFLGSENLTVSSENKNELGESSFWNFLDLTWLNIIKEAASQRTQRHGADVGSSSMIAPVKPSRLGNWQYT